VEGIQPLQLSGRRLFGVLTVGLVAAAAISDHAAGRSSLGLPSLLLPLVLGAIATALAGGVIVPWLRSIKAGQIIREDGPQAHLNKAGTPTMGGVFVIPTAVFLAWLLTGLAPAVWAVGLVTLAFGGIGWLDDWQILRKKSNRGIPPKLKLWLQAGFGSLFCLWLASTQGWTGPETSISLPLGWVLPLGLLFWPLALFVFLAESNATNLTDGLDGLAGGTGAVVLLGLGAFIGPQQPELMVFCATLGGGFLGFLYHNHNPARVFMGDTGSLALGGALTAVALLSNTLWVLLIMGGLFLWESISVILQVSYYKATKGPDGIGKRLFRMSPFHHHLELGGWSEITVVAFFYSLTALLVGVAFLLR
jgi:phospho-N-acetylmuramoyl-pentapeptide-transferase